MADGAATRVTFDELYAQHAAFVWRTVRRLGVWPADVADAAQEVFLVVHRKLPEFEGRSSINTWLFGICQRVASDWRKKRETRREAGDAGLAEMKVDPTLDDGIAQRQARALLDEALNQLDDDKRAVFVLFELEQLPMAKVAELVDCPSQTAYARLYAARETVQFALTRLARVEARAS